MPLWEFDARARDRHGASFAGNPVTLTGFVAAGSPASGLTIARFQILCCAADALRAEVRVLGTSADVPVNTWLRVTGTFAGSTVDGLPRIQARQVDVVPQPDDPFEPPAR